MAKIWRRKRKGHEIGSFYVLVDGRPVNLQTQNAKQANARARLALAGDWPPGAAADDAAAAAAPLEHADAQPDPPAAAQVVPENPPVAASLPTTGGATVEPDPIAAAAAAAGDASSAPDPTSPADDAAEMRQALRELISGQGSNGEPVDLGEVVAALQLGCEHAVASMVVARMKPPREIPPPEATGLAFRILAIGWRCQLRRWENVLDDVTPAHLIVAGTVASIAGLLAAAKKVESKVQAVEQAGGLS